MASIILAKTQSSNKISSFGEKFAKDKQKINRFKIFSNFAKS